MVLDINICIAISTLIISVSVTFILTATLSSILTLILTLLCVRSRSSKPVEQGFTLPTCINHASMVMKSLLGAVLNYAGTPKQGSLITVASGRF